jgi:hypothetical protein
LYFWRKEWRAYKIRQGTGHTFMLAQQEFLNCFSKLVCIPGQK